MFSSIYLIFFGGNPAISNHGLLRMRTHLYCCYYKNLKLILVLPFKRFYLEQRSDIYHTFDERNDLVFLILGKQKSAALEAQVNTQVNNEGMI